MNEYLIKNFGLYYPELNEYVEEYEQTSPSELVITLQDGRAYLYEDSEGSIRKLPNDKYDMTEEQYKREFGFRFRKILFRSGMTQKELSYKTGIKEAVLSRYANGKNAPSYYTAAKIAKALGCSLDDLTYI